MNPLFETYQEWRSAIAIRGGLTLDRYYCEGRIAALADEAIPTTAAFLDTYGSGYRNLIVSWFTRALGEA